MWHQLSDLQPGRNHPTAATAFGANDSENIDVADVDNDGDYDVGVCNGGDGAAAPNRIFINNGDIAFKDATYLWGKTTYEAVDTLKEEYGKDVSVLTTGPGGERLIPYATTYTDAGASGSGGLGAVMGSKNLKAIINVIRHRI